MKKISIDGSVSDDNSAPTPVEGRFNTEALKQFVAKLSLGADVEERVNDVVIRVTDNIGSAMYFANSTEDREWLRRNAYKQERRGSVTLFYLKIES